MRLTRTLLLLTAFALLPGTAQAQSFFEELFGIGRPAKRPEPPQNIPSAPPSSAPPSTTAPSADLPPRPSTPPPPRQPVVLKAPSEDNVFGQELLLNGLTGNLKLERSGSGVAARVTLPGTKISQPTETCTVKLNAGAPFAVSAEGKPEGIARFEAAAAECPLRFDVLEGSVLASTLGSSKVCSFSAADCATTPVGLWGPGAATLLSKADEFDSARGTADKAVRDNYKVMNQRMKGQDIRPVVQEQAAFSSDREELCRTYAREGAHGFCHLRYTEARAIGLAARLGANTNTPTANATPRPRRRPAPQPVDGMNPDTSTTSTLAD